MQTSTSLSFGPDYANFFSVVDPLTVASVIFYLVTLFVVIYTLISVYHWLRYGHHSVAVIPAIIVHLFASTGLILLAASGIGI
jgi:hypothetical protein